MNKKIKLGVIFPNNAIQKKANKSQFLDLKRNLNNFTVKKYHFNKNGRAEMAKDFMLGDLNVVLKNGYGRMHEAEMEIFLDENKIPYFGAGTSATLNGTSKILAKKIFLKNGLPLAKDVILNKSISTKSNEKEIKKIGSQIGYPLLVKDDAGTDSKGIFFAKDEEELRKILKKIVRDNKIYIIEEFIVNNVEATVMVVGNEKPIAYEPVELIKEKSYISNSDKCKFNLSFKIPSNLSKKIITKIKKVAVEAHNVIECKTFSRVDILILSARFKGESANDLFLKFYKSLKK